MLLYTITNGVLTIPAVSFRPDKFPFYVDPALFLRGAKEGLKDDKGIAFSFPLSISAYSFLTQVSSHPYYGKTTVKGSPIMGEYSGDDFFVEIQGDGSKFFLPTGEVGNKMLYVRGSESPIETAAQAAVMLTDDPIEIFDLAYHAVGFDRPPVYKLNFEDLRLIIEFLNTLREKTEEENRDLIEGSIQLLGVNPKLKGMELKRALVKKLISLKFIPQ